MKMIILFLCDFESNPMCLFVWILFLIVQDYDYKYASYTPNEEETKEDKEDDK